MPAKWDDYKRGYAAMWRQAALADNTASAVIQIAKNLITPDALEEYRAAGATANVPPGLIAALNYRESGGSFRRYLGNGDPLDKPTLHVPAGRGPFATWYLGAIDALHGYDRPPDGVWSIEYALFFAEGFNGRGYEQHHENSPYIWAQTNLQQRGMYSSDHGFDPTDWDTRPGVAALFLAFQTVAPNLCLPSFAAQMELPMSQTQAAPAADPLLPIINILGEVQAALPIFGALVPPPFNAILTIGVPAVEDILKFLDQARASGVQQPNVAELFDKLAVHMQTISAQLKK